MPLELRGRHATSGPPAPGGFACPACGAENTRPIEQGCASCGSGTAAARHVGETTPAGVRTSTTVRTSTLSAPPAPVFEGWTIADDACAAACTEWLRGRRLDTSHSVVAEQAFRKGWEAAMRAATAAAEKVRPNDTDQVATPDVLAGTPESRTIVAALRLFLDQVVPVAQEEIAAGEYLGATDIERLIRQLEQTSEVE